jgi:hypothetical protein
VYAKLMQKVLCCPKGNRPRVLGLTASPFQAPSNTIAITNYKEFRIAMNNAQIYKPHMPHSGAAVDWKIAEETSDQIWARNISFSGIKHSCVELSDILHDMSGDFTKSFSAPISIESGVLSRFRGELRSIRDQIKGKECKAVLAKLFFLLDALEVIDLLGPSKALSLMRSGGLELTPLEMEINTFSHRYELLLDYLRNLLKESRVIVFVSSRKAVRFLHESISTALPHLNALRVVGHGGPDGMDWADGQETAISSPREGTSQLLICTSVLEEGLDVTDCDIVIRFSGYTSLIQYIQSRGRARSTKGHMVMILTEEERCRVTEIENQERILHSTLQSLALSGEMPSYKGLEIAGRLEINYATLALSSENVSDVYNYLGGGLKIRTGWKGDKGKEGDILAVEIFVLGSIDTEDLAVSIEENLTGCVVSRCEALNATSSPPFVGREVTGILLQLKSKLPSGGQGLSAANHYDQLFRTWDFITSVISRNSKENEGREGRRPKVLSKIYRHLDDSTISPLSQLHAPNIDILRVQVGWLSDPQTFIPGDLLSVPYTRAYWEGSSCLHISSDMDIYRMSFELRSMHGFALLSSNGLDGSTTIYLPLLNPPVASYCNPMEMMEHHTRISINNRKDLITSSLANDLAVFAICPVVAITVSMNDRFRLLSSNLTGYDTRVSTISYSTIPSEVRLSQDCQWYMDILKCNRDTPIAPNIARNLKDKVAEVCVRDRENINQTEESIALAVLKQISALICALPAYWMDYLGEFDQLMGSYLMYPMAHIDR